VTEKTFQRELATQAMITPECRENRTAEGAWDEAVRRLKAEYDEIVKGWEGETERPILNLTLYCDRPVENHVPAVPPLFAGDAPRNRRRARMTDTLAAIFDGLEASRREVQKLEGERGTIGGPSRHLAQQIVRLRDWAAEQPEELLSTDEIIAPSEPEECPTCGGTGPDSVDVDFDSGIPEAACGDEWHDRFTPSEPREEKT
jgi:hypothetical protein